MGQIIPVILAILLLLSPDRAVAQQHMTLDELESPDHRALLGDLGRGHLEDQGYKLEVSAINDFWGNTHGGNYRGFGIMGNLNLLFEIDTEKAGWWENGEFVLWGIGVYGRRPSLAIGDYQFTSSIDAFDTFEPYEAYYEHSFANDTVTLLAGLHDFTIEFAVMHYGMTFINSSFNTPSTITQHPTSFYPLTGPGSRVAVRPGDDTYFMAGIYDGHTTNPNRQRAHDWGLTADDGAFMITEVGWEGDERAHDYSKVAAGAWYNTREFVDINNEERSANYGAYLLGEAELWSENEQDDQGFGAFFQGAQVPDDRNFNPWYLGLGIRYRGLFEKRDEDIIGLGFNLAQTSSRFRTLNPGTETSEQAIEFNYRAVINPVLTLTPDIQYVFNPSANKSARDALILYLRTEVKL